MHRTCVPTSAFMFSLMFSVVSDNCHGHRSSPPRYQISERRRKRLHKHQLLRSAMMRCAARHSCPMLPLPVDTIASQNTTVGRAR